MKIFDLRSGKVISTNYDTGGRLSNINNGTRYFLNSVGYLGNGNQVNSLSLGNQTSQGFAYNDRLQLTTQNLSRPGIIIQQYDYGYGQIDANGNLDLTKNNGQLGKVESYIGNNKQWTQKFSYDSIGRLAEASEFRGDTSALSYKQKFDYDRFGNMYRKTGNNANSLPYTPIEDADISKTTNRFTTNTQYDDAGNVIQDTKYRNSNFWYDANGRMYKTTSTASSGQSNAVYDASGQRVAQQIDGVWQFYIYDVGGKKVAEYGGAQAQDEGGIRYIFTDWQGSTRAIIGEGGVVQARMDYTAFGEEIAANVGMRTTVQGFNAPNKLDEKYALTERDKATGLDHTWFRKLENQGGRWTSPDPYNGSMSLGNPQSFNRYSYVENQPTNFVDPSGLLLEYTCYDINTYWSQGSFRSGVMTTTRCHFRVLPSEGGGEIDVGGGGGGNPRGGEDNCITNAIANGKATNRKGYDVTFKHDGMHVYSESGGKDVNVTALAAMAGTIKRVRSQGDGLYRMDILLNKSINGEPYYLILKDFTEIGNAAGGNKIGARNIKIKGDEILGKVRGEVSPPSIDFKGLHVTLISAKNYAELTRNIQKKKNSPQEWLMNAATDPNSPFRCQ